MVFKRNCGWQVKEECLACLRSLLELAVCSSPKSFIQIFTSCVVIIADVNDPGNVSGCSEELKLSALKVLKELVSNTPEDVLLPMYSNEQLRVQIGHAIFLFIKIAQHESSRTLRIVALETICKFTLEDIFVDKISNIDSEATTASTITTTSTARDLNDTEIPPSIFAESKGVTESSKGSFAGSTRQACSAAEREQQRRGARDALSTFLPGVCTASARIAVADETKGHKLAVASMRTLCVMLVVVLEDTFISSVVKSCDADALITTLQRKMNITADTAHTPHETKKREDKKPTNTITKSWLEATGTKVVQLVEGVCRQLVMHSHVSVRRQLVRFAVDLLRHCSRTVPGLIIPCIEALATLAADQNPSVNSFARTALQERHLNGDLEKSLVEGKPTRYQGVNGCSSTESTQYLKCQKKHRLPGADAEEYKGSNDNTTKMNEEVCLQNHVSRSDDSLTIDSCCESSLGTGTSVSGPKLASVPGGEASKAAGNNGTGSLSPEICCALQEQFSRAIKRLPTVARSSDGRNVRALVQRLQGYMTLLGDKELFEVLQLPGQGTSLVVSLASCLALDSRDRDLLLHRPSTADMWSIPAVPCALGERYLFVQDNEVVCGCRDVAAGVGLCLTPALLLQMWMDALSSAQHLTPEVISLLPALLRGHSAAKRSRASPSQEEKEEFVNSVLEFLLSEKMLFAPTDVNVFRNTRESAHFSSSAASSSDDQCYELEMKPSKLSNVSDSLEHIYSRFNSPFNPCVSNSESSLALSRSRDTRETSLSLYGCQRNVLTVSYSLLAVAACARLMGPSFIMFFSRVMCPLLEMCGDSNLLIAHSARKSLEEMSASCGYSGVVELVEAAVPHFWYPLSMQLRRPRLHPRAPLVLQAALACGSRRSSACLTECLQQLMYELLRCLDSHESLCPQQLLAVLRLYMATKVRDVTMHKDTAERIVLGEDSLQLQAVKATTGDGDSQKNFSASEGNEETRISNVVHSNVVINGHGHRSKLTNKLSLNESNVNINLHTFKQNAGDPLNCSVTDDDLVVNGEKRIKKSNHAVSVDSMSTNCDKVSASLQCSEGESSSNASQCQSENDSTELGPLATFMKEFHRKEEQQREKFETEQASILEEVNATMQKEEEKARAAGKPYWERTSSDFAQNPDQDGSDSGIGTAKGDKNASDIEDAGEASPEEDNKPKEKEIPEDVRLIVSILERCCFLLHTRDHETSLVLLDTIELGCLALKQWENSQLPVMHKAWKPLLLRIKDHYRPVSLRALTVCCVMVASSGDFLRKRCLKDLLPALNKFLVLQSSASQFYSVSITGMNTCRRFLVLQSSVSRGQTARTGYLMSTAYATQLRLLETLYPELVDKLNLTGAEMVDAVNCYAMYLDCSQPAPLVKASVLGLRAAAITHPETVWFALSCLLPPQVLRPPTPRHRLLRLDGGLAGDSKRVPAEAHLLFQELS
ncbi:Armadillo-type fold [Trinorchestia longiramus]|nr:Armadillo-type fold [Trinorchestia longiramus]